jgi:hypothetical protein
MFTDAVLSVLANFLLVPPRNSAVRPTEQITDNTETSDLKAASGDLGLMTQKSPAVVF